MDIIKKYEGFRGLAYKCPAGVWTYGFGSTTKKDGSPVKEGDKITESEAEVLLTDWLIKYANPIIATIPNLKECQKQALQSLIYNIGAGAFKSSRLYKALKEKDTYEIFKQWDFGTKMKLNGIIKRRAEELHYFMSGV